MFFVKKITLLSLLASFYLLSMTLPKELLSYSQPSLKKMGANERQLNSQFKKNDPKESVIINDAYIPNASHYDLTQPLVFIRPNSWILPDCKVDYFLSAKDSIVRIVMYDCIIKTGSTTIRKKEKNIFDKLYKDITNR